MYMLAGSCVKITSLDEPTEQSRAWGRGSASTPYFEKQELNWMEHIKRIVLDQRKMQDFRWYQVHYSTRTWQYVTAVQNKKQHTSSMTTMPFLSISRCDRSACPLNPQGKHTENKMAFACLRKLCLYAYAYWTKWLRIQRLAYNYYLRTTWCYNTARRTDTPPGLLIHTAWLLYFQANPNPTTPYKYS